MLVVAAACCGALEVGEGGAGDGEGLGCVACAGYLFAVSLRLVSGRGGRGGHTGSAAAPPRAPVNTWGRG